jgi:hypothetical protein
MLAQADFSKTVLRIAHVAKPKTPLELKVDAVINLVKVRAKELSIEEAAESLRLHVLDLRQSLFEFFAQNDLQSNQYLNNLSDYQAETIEGKHLQALREEVTEVLEVHHTIFASIAQKTGMKGFGQVSKEFPSNMEDLFLIKGISPEAIQRLLEKSIDFEFSIIVSNLLLQGDLVLNWSKVKQLITFMDRSISSYGGFLILFKLWEPTHSLEDSPRLIMNMRMLSSNYQFKYMPQTLKKMSIEEVKQLILG